jgi:Cys-Gly metallodipeptidase DUG1
MGDWLEQQLRNYGVDTKQVDLSEIVPTPDLPKLVLGKIDGAPGNNLKTVLVYGHYDVQPVSGFSDQSYYILA